MTDRDEVALMLLLFAEKFGWRTPMFEDVERYNLLRALGPFPVQLQSVTALQALGLARVYEDEDGRFVEITTQGMEAVIAKGLIEPSTGEN